MPNKWGEQHPWERAGLEHREWLDVLRYTIKRWVNVADELHATFAGEGGGFTVERWRNLKREHDEAHQEHWKVLQGDRYTCGRIHEKLRAGDA